MLVRSSATRYVLYLLLVPRGSLIRSSLVPIIGSTMSTSLSIKQPIKQSITSRASIACESVPTLLMQKSRMNPDMPSTQSTSKPTGPISREYHIPSRVKPGRKPVLHDSHPDRRKQQNRESQRAYRDRRADRVKELEQSLEVLNKSYHDAKTGYVQDISRLQNESMTWQTSYQSLRTKCDALESELNGLKSAFALGQQSVTGQKAEVESTPIRKRQRLSTLPSQAPQSDHEMEVDFTAKFAKPTKDSGVVNTTSMEHDSCGFCTDEQNCLCKADDTSNLEPGFVAVLDNAKSADDRMSIAALTGPGSCDQCRADPARARQCIDLARSARPVDSGTSASVNTPTLTDAPTVSCSDFIRQLPPPTDETGPTRGKRGHQEAFGRLRVYPYIRPAPAKAATVMDQETQRHGPAFALDAAEAAQVLASFSRQ